jgi:hypothetical protein
MKTFVASVDDSLVFRAPVRLKVLRTEGRKVYFGLEPSGADSLASDVLEIGEGATAKDLAFVALRRR